MQICEKCSWWLLTVYFLSDSLPSSNKRELFRRWCFHSKDNSFSKEILLRSRKIDGIVLNTKWAKPCTFIGKRLQVHQ